MQEEDDLILVYDESPAIESGYDANVDTTFQWTSILGAAIVFAVGVSLFPSKSIFFKGNERHTTINLQSGVNCSLKSILVLYMFKLCLLLAYSNASKNLSFDYLFFL